MPLNKQTQKTVNSYSWNKDKKTKKTILFQYVKAMNVLSICK